MTSVISDTLSTPGRSVLVQSDPLAATAPTERVRADELRQGDKLVASDGRIGTLSFVHVEGNVVVLRNRYESQHGFPKVFRVLSSTKFVRQKR